MDRIERICSQLSQAQKRGLLTAQIVGFSDYVTLLLDYTVAQSLYVNNLILSEHTPSMLTVLGKEVRQHLNGSLEAKNEGKPHV